MGNEGKEEEREERGEGENEEEPPDTNEEAKNSLQGVLKSAVLR